MKRSSEYSMKHILAVIVFFFIYLYQLPAQNSFRQTWVKVKAERKDESRIVDRSNIENNYLEYRFTKDKVYIVISPEQIAELSYTLHSNELTIGNFIRYSVENLTDSNLVLLEKPYENLPEDKFNRYFFVKKDYYIADLIKKNRLTFENDSTIIASPKLFPVYSKGSFSEFVLGKIPRSKQTIVTGSFIVSTNNNITDFKLENRGNYKAKMELKFKKAIKSTSQKWLLPSPTLPYNYRVNFTANIHPEFTVSFVFHYLDRNKFVDTGLTLEQINQASDHFKNGVDLISKNEFEKAINEFTQCIAIDSKFIDAYYNRARLNYRLGKIKNACSDWRYLTSLDQKNAEELFNQNCIDKN